MNDEVLLAFDGGPGYGLGHERRMTALARTLARVDVATRLVPVEAGVRLEGPIVVVDAYSLRADDPHLVSADLVVAVDDLHRNLAVDLLVEPGLAARAAGDHAARARLAGPRYTLLDPAISGKAAAPITPLARRVLVTFGATTAVRDLSLGVATSLAERTPGADVRVALGPWNTGARTDAVSVLPPLDSLTIEVATADVVVCAGGVTMLEALALGRPVVAVRTAANQDDNLRGASAADAVVLATPDTAASAAGSLLADIDARRMLHRNGPALVDGRGAERVATELVRLGSQRGNRHVV